MKRRISSTLTFFNKYIFTTIWIGGWGLGTIVNILRGTASPQDDGIQWLFLLVWLLAAPSLYLWLGGLKKVSIDNKFLYVSNYLKEILIPLTEIVDVTETLFLNPKTVTITLKSASAFGKKIRFIPTYMFLISVTSHPIVKELKSMREDAYNEDDYQLKRLRM